MALLLNSLVPWLAGLVVGIGALVLLFGWTIGVEKLVIFGPTAAGMAPSTTVSFILCGAAVLCLHRMQPHRPPSTSLAVLLMASVTGLIALINLAVRALTPHHGIDEIIFPWGAQPASVYMSPVTATCALAAAICLVAVVRDGPAGRLAFAFSATTGLLIALVALTGYAFDANALYEVFLFTAMAVHTAAGFALLFAALLILRPEWSWVGIVAGEGAGSAAVRRLMPAVICTPFILAWLALRATNAGLFTVNFRLSLIAILIIALLAGLLLWNGATQNRAESSLRRSLDLLRRTVAERDLLLREVYHRVKNNLQQIDALIAIESLQIEDEKAKESFRATGGRVRALGAVHQMLLSSGDLSSFGVDAFLQDLCADIARGLGTEKRGIEITVKAQPEVVELDYAIPLGLLVNELITNAFKYAFPGDGGGRIDVGYRLRASGGAILEVSDNGIGMSSGDLAEGTGGSVGSVIIQSLVGQLQAEMTVDGSRGTTVRVAVPSGISGART